MPKASNPYYLRQIRGMQKRSTEWLKQADYDLDTAGYMYTGGRYPYAVFMSHLAVEKALKGLYYEKRQQIPPKSHSLQYLLNEIGIKPPPSHGKFIIKLSEASIPTRYPEDLEKMKKDFTPEAVGDILMKAQEVIQWIKKQL
jgi:HEPN domain-containing protein